ncbi:MAG: DinB family protein [Acidimicrobiia bacterium]|nr:DinB family protein [Acidimicrobiia bacterium]
MSWPETRPSPPPIDNHADEREMLRHFLDYYRAALIDRAWGLTVEQLQIALPPSTLTLSRLIGHMTLVEEHWFRVRFDGEDFSERSAAFDFDADPDAEMTHAQSLSIDELIAAFEAAVADARAREEAVESLDQVSRRSHPRTGETWNLRWIMVHMIEEYARHCGHADFIRESIDGDTAG